MRWCPSADCTNAIRVQVSGVLIHWEICNEIPFLYIINYCVLVGRLATSHLRLRIYVLFPMWTWVARSCKMPVAQKVGKYTKTHLQM